MSKQPKNCLNTLKRSKVTQNYLAIFYQGAFQITKQFVASVLYFMLCELPTTESRKPFSLSDQSKIVKKIKMIRMYEAAIYLDLSNLIKKKELRIKNKIDNFFTN
jgi:hypothetical protein